MKITDYQPQPAAVTITYRIELLKAEIEAVQERISKNAEKISDDREYVAALSAEIAEHEKALSFIEAPNG